MASDDDASATSGDRPSPRLERWLFPVVFVGCAGMLIVSILDGDRKHAGFFAGALIVFLWFHFNRWVLHLSFGSPAFRLDRIQKPELFIAGSIIALGSLMSF